MYRTWRVASRIKTLAAVMAIAASSVAIMVLLQITAPDQPAQLRQPAPARVESVAVQRMDLSPVETLTGRLRPKRRAELRFEVSGVVTERLVEPGQSVDRGADLLALDPGDYADAADDAEAQLRLEEEGVERDRRLLELARRNRKLQQQEVERLNKLGADSLVSRSRLDEARQRLAQLESEEARLRYGVESADARLRLRETALRRARRSLQRTRLRAPFAGVVNQVRVQVGDWVSNNQQAVELVDLSALELRLEARAEVAAAQTLGDTVPVEVDERTWEGRLVAIQPDPDPTTLTYALRVRLDPEAGRPGELARVQLSLTGLREVLAIPATAVVYAEADAYVFVVNDGVLERRKVRLGDRVGDLQVVREGLQPGTRIVRRDAAGLTDGQQVLVDPPDATIAAEPR